MVWKLHQNLRFAKMSPNFIFFYNFFFSSLKIIFKFFNFTKPSNCWFGIFEF